MKTIGLLILVFIFLKKKQQWFSRVAVLFLVFLILDLVSKAVAQWAVVNQLEWWPWPVISNTGLSFGFGEILLQSFEEGATLNQHVSLDAILLIGWVLLAAGISIFLLTQLRTVLIKSSQNSTAFLFELATGLLLGGIWGNVFDRIFVGGVRDWLPVPGYELFFGLTLYNNLADWFLTLGCILWIYLLFFKIKTL